MLASLAHFRRRVGAFIGGFEAGLANRRLRGFRHKPCASQYADRGGGDNAWACGLLVWTRFLLDELGQPGPG